MRKKLLLATLLLTVMASLTTAMAQTTIPGTSVRFKLNNQDWRYLRTLNTDDGGQLSIYCYVGEMIVDMEGDTVLPFLRIYTVSDYDGTLYDLVSDRWEQQPYQTVSEFRKGAGIPRKGGLGFMAAYTNPSDQKDYQFLMTYFEDKGTLVEFRLETTKDTFNEMEFEFRDILGTLK